MHNITFISTIHEEHGKCNADELQKIMEEINPEVIFLEALENTYSNYDKLLFTSFGIYHKKLEINAIQKHSISAMFEYVPVLDIGLSDTFEKKYGLICENIEWQKMLDDYKSLAEEQGFQFLNSAKSIALQEEMRMFENRLLKNHEINIANDINIDAYENSMMRNIYSYCKSNQFNKAIFMCGDAHRKSILEKMENYNSQETIKLNWLNF